MHLNKIGRLNRRELLAGLAALAAPSSRAQDLLMRVASLDHVSILVSDVEKSVAFYRRIFGDHVLKARTGQRRYFMLGTCYAAIGPARPEESRRVDHFCPGIEGFDAASLQAKLEQRGTPSKTVNVGLYVTDPDGILIQLWNVESWKLNKAEPETAPEKVAAVFRPLGLDHLLLRVPDPDKSAAFYQKLFGPPNQRSKEPPRIWWQFGKSRVGLSPLAFGQSAGVDHFCVLVEPFDQTAAATRLRELGAKADSQSTAASPQFRDLDGISVQVAARS